MTDCADPQLGAGEDLEMSHPPVWRDNRLGKSREVPEHFEIGYEIQHYRDLGAEAGPYQTAVKASCWSVEA